MKLYPFLDEDEQVYRVGGRIGKASLSYDLRHPYLIPKNYIGLLIEKHGHTLHGGHLSTAIEIHKNFWIIGDLNLSRGVIQHDCKVCRHYRGKPVQQQMADLPACRVMPFSRLFQTTMVDYLGPILVKLNQNTTTKGYGAIFICTVLGAVHLTCVQDFSTSAFLQALDRFVSTRGAPAVMISDNATCFRGADNEIGKLCLRLDPSQIQSNTQRFKIEWTTC